MEAEKPQLLARPSSSTTSGFPNVPYKLYEEWIHVEAQLDVFHELHTTCSISGVAFEDTRVKARKARLACGYDPTMPRPGEENENKEDTMDRLEEDGWYDSIYPQGEDDEDAGSRDGDGIGGQGDDVAGGRADENCFFSLLFCMFLFGVSKSLCKNLLSMNIKVDFCFHLCSYYLL